MIVCVLILIINLFSGTAFSLQIGFKNKICYLTLCAGQAVKRQGRVLGEMCRAMNIRECCGGGGYVTQNNHKKKMPLLETSGTNILEIHKCFFYYDRISVQKMSENINIKSLSSPSPEVM